ncbi:LAFA_0E17634g1_1 [Lachancea sp. 'fantastica']|nr:LAFA_0E17634g1_1 [Lachancea sp. 'fantastica']
MSGREDIRNLLSEAAKFYAAKDYERSTNLYSEVNAMHDALTGESSADYLFLYGKSLYQLALSQSEVFGGDEGEQDGAQGDDDAGSDEEEKSGENKQLYQFSDVVAEGEVPEGDNNGDEAPQEDEEEEEEEEKDGDDHGEEEEPQEEQASDFENAWEMLELARSIYEKTQPQDQEILEKLCETYSILGEISLETENFTQATQDLTRCLELRKQAYGDKDPTHRLIIESHYKLFLALELDPTQDAQSQEQLEKAIQLLQARIQAGKAEKDEEGLLEELKLKLKELKTSQQALDALNKASVAQLKEALICGKTSVDKPASINDLTSMVKKRKPKSQSNQDLDSTLKKQKK